jgi:hypothetical protein
MVPYAFIVWRKYLSNTKYLISFSETRYEPVPKLKLVRIQKIVTLQVLEIVEYVLA